MTNYFITTRWMQEQGVVNKNIDEQLYANLIKPAATAFLKGMLGNHFYLDLLTKYNNESMNADELVLLDYIQWSVAYRVKSELTLEATLQLTNKGLQLQDSDNSTSVDIKTMGIRMNDLIARANQFEMEMKAYLIENKDSFPEFTSELNTNSSIKNQCCKGGGNYNEASGLFII